MILDSKKYIFNTYLSENMYRDQNNYLVCQNAVFGRTGIQKYGAKELGLIDKSGIIEVHRLEKDVFDEDSLASLDRRPFTLTHPNEKVTIKNHKQYSKGEVYNIRREDNNIVGDIIVQDEEVADLIESGKMRELSLGYSQTLNYDEETDTYSFTNIIYNHLALVQKGRAGNAMIFDGERKEIMELENEVLETNETQEDVVVEDKTIENVVEETQVQDSISNFDLNDKILEKLYEYKYVDRDGYNVGLYWLTDVYSSEEQPYFVFKDKSLDKYFKVNYNIVDNNVEFDLETKEEVQLEWINKTSSVKDSEPTDIKEEIKKEEGEIKQMQDNVIVKDTAYFLSMQEKIASMPDGEMKKALSKSLENEMKEHLSTVVTDSEPTVVVTDEQPKEDEVLVNDSETLQNYLDQFNPNLYSSKSEYEAKMRELCISTSVSTMARKEKFAK